MRRTFILQPSVGFVWSSTWKLTHICKLAEFPSILKVKTMNKNTSSWKPHTSAVWQEEFPGGAREQRCLSIQCLLSTYYVAGPILALETQRCLRDCRWLEMLASHMRKQWNHWWGEHSGVWGHLQRAHWWTILQKVGWFPGWLPRGRARTNGWRTDLSFFSEIFQTELLRAGMTGMKRATPLKGVQAIGWEGGKDFELSAHYQPVQPWYFMMP